MRILIADDDNFSRRLLSATLTHWGFDVIEARDGAEALEILERDQTLPLIIVDGFMPAMNGIDLVRVLRRKPRRCQPFAIMLTGSDNHTGAAEAFEAGVDEYLRKPFKPDELRAKMKIGAKAANLALKSNSHPPQLS